MSTIDYIIRKSLAESSQEKRELRQQQAIHDALKAMWILCKDQPHDKHIDIKGVKRDSDLYSIIETLAQPECQRIMQSLAERVRSIDEEVAQ
jgi:hypothetical protein